ncbi:MAG: hypothetical protein KDD03_13270 [Gelidibacter sp.]|nr:hypothetical protein [Gelidibacter sp.]
MYTFKQALKNCNFDQKIIYGTRTEMFHIIGKDDRDYNTNYSTTLEQAKELGEVKIVLKSLGKL